MKLEDFLDDIEAHRLVREFPEKTKKFKSLEAQAISAPYIRESRVEPINMK